MASKFTLEEKWKHNTDEASLALWDELVWWSEMRERVCSKENGGRLGLGGVECTGRKGSSAFWRLFSVLVSFSDGESVLSKESAVECCNQGRSEEESLAEGG